MALAKGTNSYATVAEADVYFDDRIDALAWISSGSDRKAQALTTATALLDELPWTGSAVSGSQLLAFPRTGSYFDPRVGAEVVFTSATPKRVLRGLYELALHLVLNESILDQTGSVDSLSLGGSISLEKIRPASVIPLSIKTSLKCMLDNGGTNLWWRAN